VRGWKSKNDVGNSNLERTAWKGNVERQRGKSNLGRALEQEQSARKTQGRKGERVTMGRQIWMNQLPILGMEVAPPTSSVSASPVTEFASASTFALPCGCRLHCYRLGQSSSSGTGFACFYEGTSRLVAATVPRCHKENLALNAQLWHATKHQVNLCRTHRLPPTSKSPPGVSPIPSWRYTIDLAVL